MVAYAEKLVALKLHGYESLELILNAAKKAKTIESVVMCYADLEEAVFDYLPYKQVKDKITNPKFTLNTGWETKTGSFTGGDQRLATHDGVTCWNAWWSGIDADNETQSMAISQDLTFPGTTPMHGLYALSVRLLQSITVFQTSMVILQMVP